MKLVYLPFRTNSIQHIIRETGHTPKQPCLTAGIQEQGRRVHQDVWGCEVECKMGGCGQVLEKEDNPQGAQASLHSQALPELSCNVMDL